MRNKIFSIISVLIMFFTFAACDEGTTEPMSTDSDESLIIKEETVENNTPLLSETTDDAIIDSVVSNPNETAEQQAETLEESAEETTSEEEINTPEETASENTEVKDEKAEEVFSEEPEQETKPDEEKKETETESESKPEAPKENTLSEPLPLVTQQPASASSSAVASSTPESQSSTAPETSNVTADASNCDYVLNTNSDKFHYPSCGSVKKMAPHNTKYFIGSRDEAIAKGYDPCGKCKP